MWQHGFLQEPGGAGLFILDSSPNLQLIISCSLHFHLPHFLSLQLGNATAAWHPPQPGNPQMTLLPSHLTPCGYPTTTTLCWRGWLGGGGLEGLG